MPNLKITPADLPGAPFHLLTPIAVGRGWLPLVREALAVIGDGEIVAIREDAGALRIELAHRRPGRSTPEQRAALREIAQRSLNVCEICGAGGRLRYDGLKAGRPAGWHRSRCDLHVNTRTDSR